ncbi:methyltransferase [Micrococcus terreus]|uniref:class I SAM-dependent methyltransferase n=1 Tax=Micrococcus terreus TaxID=574650 RepID=UPI0021A4B95C|nr:class I SAM-dependent methyltransferase [Micrococcus terreus]MCT2088635.1 methyltransferase [Micrococcus terreus]
MTSTVPPGQTPDAVLGRLATTLTQDFPFADLVRDPLPTGAGLQAHDAADLLLLDTVATWAQARHPLDPVVVLDDRHGALTLPLLAAGVSVRLGQDSLSHERSVALNAQRFAAHLAASGQLTLGEIGPELLAGARTVLLPLPRSLDALDQTAHLVAEHAHEDVVLLAGGRDKHMSPRMNEVLSRSFTSVVAGRGRSKSRVITARGPRRGRPAPFPRTRAQELPDVGSVTLAAYGATFGGARLDPGTRLLLEAMAAAVHSGRLTTERAIDLGCGNGTIALWLALQWAGLSVLATDQSADACRSAELTARENGVLDRVEIRRDDALSSVDEASEPLVVLNPPFHDGNAVDPGVAQRLIAEAARVLEDGGQLWCVWNSHLRYRPLLERLVGQTRQVARDRQFTVTVSSRRR